jgi:uncharacterized membrane protein required for colicin V production
MPIWDIILGAIVLVIVVISIAQGVLRSVIMMAELYLATAVAGFTYNYLATFMRGITEEYRSLRETIGFALAFIIVVIIVEVLHRKGFPDTKLVKLKFLDNLLAIIPGILSGLIFVTVVLSCAGHSGFLSRQAVQSFISYPFWSQFMAFFAITLRFWYISGLPLVLRFMLPDENEL